MTAIQPPQIDAASERLLEAARVRRVEALPRRERAVEVVTGLLTLAAVVAFALLAHASRPFDAPLAFGLVVAYAALSRVRFNLGDGYVIPTHLVFVPMLLLLPTPLVPLLVTAAGLLEGCRELARRRMSPDRLLIGLGDASFALAPAVVLVALGAQLPSLSHCPAYAAALAAQLVADTLREVGRAAVAKDVHPRVILREMRETHRVDALLAPIGLLAALAAADTPAAILLVLPLVYLLLVFSRERDARIAQTIAMSRSFRGTALLLRDLLEEDDEYTGRHTEDVVELAVAVAERMGVSEDVRRETELGALLHDIGKIHIPDSIINKPGKLDDAEWAIMKTHTVEGQRMLDQVGGLLTEVGLVVRASHERYDGGGYPDGLAGEQIPLGARIVAACDSFNAMTTTRSYRKALSVAHAVEELQRCSGTQFDPVVVVALLAIIGDPGWTLTVREPAKPAAIAPATGAGAEAQAAA